MELAAFLPVSLLGLVVLYIRLRWRRAPQAFTAMVGVAVCYFVAGAVLGMWVLHLFGPSASSTAPLPSEQQSVAAPIINLEDATNGLGAVAIRRKVLAPS